MAKTSYLGANIAVATDTFREWVNRTNQLVYDQGTIVITVGSVATPNSTNHTITSGNGYVNGTFSANTLAVTQNLRGGTVDTAAVMTVGSNTVPSVNVTHEVGNTTMFYGNGYFKNVISAGDVEANYSSDKKLKTDLQKIEHALEVVKKINGYMFKWKTDDEKNGREDLGVIAQEVQEELPFLVTRNGNGHLAVKYQSLIPLLLEAIKELSVKVEELENK
jgi:hypothetical protein